MPIDRESIAGVVLAGGQSRRMGGGDKGLLMLGDKPMLAHVIERFAPQVSALVLSANGDPVRFAVLGLPVVADTLHGFPGPLAGVLAGMRWAQTAVPRSRWIASVSSDVPLLPRDVVARLAAAAVEFNAPIAFAQACGRQHPVIALWSIDLADALERSLIAGEYRVRYWAAAHGAVTVEFAPLSIGGEPVDPFFNANTREELAEADRLLAHGVL